MTIAPDGTLVGPSRREVLSSKGICYTCQMKHLPYCNDEYVGCRICTCGKEWHPMDGPCRIGPETEFITMNCYCKGYIPLDNIQYLEWMVDKNV